MTDKQIINSCEFQSRCIQYKDMYSNKHIKCPIVDFAIACRGENKCKYKTVYEQLKRKEEECEMLSKGYAELTEIVRPYIDDFTGYNEKLGGFDIVLCVKELLQQLDSLKAEVKSKTEYIQEQREIINQYSKEIEMYKKCQGKRASKREEELKAKNEKLKQTLTEIKDIAENVQSFVGRIDIEDDVFEQMEQILQKISEC